MSFPPIAIGGQLEPAPETGEDAKPANTAPSENASSSDASRNAPQEASRERNKPAKGKASTDELSNERSPESEEAFTLLREQCTEHARQKMERRLAELTEELGLSDAEASRLERQMRADFEETENLINVLMNGEFSEERIQRLADLHHPNLVAERQAQSLGGEAGERLLTVTEIERSWEIEQRAMLFTNDLHKIVNLTKDQKKAVLQIYTEGEAEGYDNTSPTNPNQRAYEVIFNWLRGLNPNYMDPEDINLVREFQRKGFQAVHPRPKTPPPETQEEIDVKAGVKASVEDAVNHLTKRFSGILTPEQIAAYREHENKRAAEILSSLEAAEATK
ncbi:hypothetical protein [Sulfuriroseicoccus oceanibius]|uniref:Uncharacterized protein n=1 Tax=Sulfuriroseicoccus oceanibius TaxID=2707525 RepID=A0A6B3LDP3_9BACT|nr:hypothetical protein [Sulfuriroseicoccus oceanibius]QQL45106.1 hypothetical protein G3M56_000520 [Sulfuriroseicoccus oceanibius]